LDPEQNHTFQDHYLSLPFDLSHVIFICTANSIDPIPHALRDRLEIIEIPGYTLTDKLQIAERYLIPQQLAEHGLTTRHCRISAAALKAVVEGYTRESGVRNLSRNIASIMRGVAAKIAETLPPVVVDNNPAADNTHAAKTQSTTTADAAQTPAGVDIPADTLSVTVEPEDLHGYLGPVQFESELALRTSTPGVATGLAYTPVGGDILFVEASRMQGKGRLTITGQIGRVMGESAQAALSLLKSRGDRFNLDPTDFSKTDIHIHVPAGAIPKDGPSAGVSMYTALVSLFTGQAVRPDVAMTGEITLRGLVLPIGGVKEKLIAAHRAGIKVALLPKRNEKDVAEIKPPLKGIAIEFVNNVDELIHMAIPSLVGSTRSTSPGRQTGATASARRGTARTGNRRHTFTPPGNL
jgi:ATP-dependent Lon protease